jgi:hypothetical protein
MLAIFRRFQIYDLSVSARLDGEPALRLLWPHQFAVMLEDDLRAISRFQRHLRGGLDLGQPVTDERMPQRVLLPLRLRRFFLKGSLIAWHGSLFHFPALSRG